MTTPTATDRYLDYAPSECSCSVCADLCKSLPGWLVPDDLPRIAAHLGLSEQELFNTRLQVDWWDDESLRILAPLRFPHAPGTLVPFFPHGRCTFLTEDDLCEIHEVKPQECLRCRGCGYNPRDVVQRYHEAFMEAWDAPEHQDTIRRLLRGKRSP